MVVLIDPPLWPAHGTVWSHLVSDASLAELHEFAARGGIPLRGFDHDHYDVPADHYDEMLALGAQPVSSGELVRMLIGSGLRVPGRERTPRRSVATAVARERWNALLPGQPDLGRELLGRWSEPHRHYHDVRHLVHCLASLDQLSDGGADRAVVLAAWFHDAVYQGVPGDDEEASASLAEHLLRGVVGAGEAAEVARLVRMTAGHAPSPGDDDGALLSDADLSILAVNEGRYHVYLRDVRLDYAHVPAEAFREGRRQVVESLIAMVPLFRTPRGMDLWEVPARANLTAELQDLGAEQGLLGAMLRKSAAHAG